MKRVKIIGIGDGMANIINHMAWLDEEGHEWLIINSDSKSFERYSQVAQLILCEAWGGRGNPNFARVGVDMTVDEIKQRLEEAEVVLLVSALGGGTGSGATPLVAMIAKEMGIKTHAFVTFPFTHEGPVRRLQAQEAIEDLRPCVDRLMVYPLGLAPIRWPKGYEGSVFSLMDGMLHQELLAVISNL